MPLPEDYNTPNTVQWYANTIDGGVINYQTYSGKIQVLILFRASGTCGNSNGTIRSIAASDWVSNDNVQVIAIGVGESGESENVVKEHVISYKQQYAPYCNDIVFGYVESSDFWLDFIFPYRGLMGLSTSGAISITYAVNYIIDTDNNFRFTWQGSYLADYYASTLSLLDNSFDDSYGVYRITISGVSDYSSAYEELDILNEYRLQNGLSALTMDEELLETAMQRAAEIAVFYDHTRPDYSDCFTAFPARSNGMMKRENIALGQRSAQEVMTSWKNSSGHNANILADGNRSVGIGCFIDSSGTAYWVQVFSNAYGIEESIKSSGAKAVTREISAVTGVLDFAITPNKAELRIDNTLSLTVVNTNTSWVYSRPEIGATYVASDNTGIATASIDAEGRIVITPVSVGSTVIKVGFMSATTGSPLTVNVSVTVKPPYDPGDLNGDGMVNITDAIELLKYVAKLDNNVVNVAGTDIDGNGKVNINDAIALLKQIAGLNR